MEQHRIDVFPSRMTTFHWASPKRRRRRRSLHVLALALLLGALPATARAGGWVQELFKLYAKLTYGTSSANTVYRFDGAEKYPTDNPPFTVRNYPIAERSLFLYAEYGLLRDLTLVGSAAFKRVVITSPVERKEVEGLGDIYVAGRYLLSSFDQQVVSATLGVTLPTGYSRDLTPPLGSGNLNIEVAGNYGISFYPLPAYATGSIGYRGRTGIFPSRLKNETRPFAPDYADEIFANVEAGYTIGDRLLLHAVGQSLFSTRTDDNDFDVEHPPETQQYVKVGGGVIVRAIDGVSLSVDAAFTPYGRKASNSFDLSIGVAWEGTVFGNE